MLSMSAIDRQGQKELNIGKAFINTRRVNSAKFGYEAHFMHYKSCNKPIISSWLYRTYYTVNKRLSVYYAPGAGCTKAG